jgi:hypothetical protein
MEETYEKVFIRSEADLPKEQGRYFYHHKKANRIEASEYLFTHDEFWVNHIDWYLQPISQPLSRERVIEVLNKHIMPQDLDRNRYNLKGGKDAAFDNIYSELCDAGQREETKCIVANHNFVCDDKGNLKCSDCNVTISYPFDESQPKPAVEQPEQAESAEEWLRSKKYTPDLMFSFEWVVRELNEYAQQSPDKAIIAKQEELIEFYEKLFDGDMAEHVSESRLKRELAALRTKNQ